ncbi:MAG: glycoside hydrolase family 127 protein [Planctomycetes bacterium]|nr:glycoside hydrolase family 127 protein [Planctomycetota bacterium]
MRSTPHNTTHARCPIAKDWTMSLTGLALLCLASFPQDASQAPPPRRVVPFTQVRVEDDFWTPRLRTNREVTIPFALDKCEETGRIANFAVAGKLEAGGFRGRYYDDSDVYKVLEGASYALAEERDPALERRVDDVIAKIAAAQEEDGYLYTIRTIGDPSVDYGGKEARWSNVAHGHELYNLGHLYEAAVAHHLATGKRTLLDVAVKSAELVCRVFGPGEGQRFDAPGHQEIEIGLVRLSRVTGERKYLEQAKFFLEARGRADKRKVFGSYSQDHIPVLEQREAVGHAVRAGYMFAGMADVAVASGDARYLDAARRIWNDTLERKTYLTGSVGSRRGGEAFGDGYELPDASAYNETCAAIAQAFLHQRMFLLGEGARAVDALERVIHNGFLAGISLSGDRFFYPNPLACDGHTKFNQGVLGRSPWFACSCCPVNIVRFLPRLPEWIYALEGEDTLYVNLYVGNRAHCEVARTEVALRLQSSMPWEGRATLAIDPQEERRFTVALRVPGYVRGHAFPSALHRELDPVPQAFLVRLGGQTLSVPIDGDGYVRVRRSWKAGDVLELAWPLTIRRMVADERVDAMRGRIALERGPLVYCAEGCDHEGSVSDLVLRDEVFLHVTRHPRFLGEHAIVAIEGRVARVSRGDDGNLREREASLFAIPYYAWAHREVGTMQVFLARTPEVADVPPPPTIASRATPSASHTNGSDTVEALNDQRDPSSSGDHSIPRHTFWPHLGTSEWLQYTFDEARRVSEVEVYWFDDTGRGQCRVPAAWALFARVDGTWQPVETRDPYGVEPDRYHRVRFAPVVADALRIEVQLRDGVSGGVLEWRVR